MGNHKSGEKRNDEDINRRINEFNFGPMRHTSPLGLVDKISTRFHVAIVDSAEGKIFLFN